MNEALTITGAILAVLTALVFNRKDVSDLKADIKEGNAALRADMKASIGGLRTEMQEGFARVEARFERLETRMDKMQADINTFATVNALHDHRISALESAAKS
jgi:hypothetical protein